MSPGEQIDARVLALLSVGKVSSEQARYVLGLSAVTLRHSLQRLRTRGLVEYREPVWGLL